MLPGIVIYLFEKKKLLSRHFIQLDDIIADPDLDPFGSVGIILMDLGPNLSRKTVPEPNYTFYSGTIEVQLHLRGTTSLMRYSTPTSYIYEV
jgi:hypothetical protein